MMEITRRRFLGVLSASVLTGCGAGVQNGALPFQAKSNPGFDQWLTGFRVRAVARGIDRGVLDRALRNAGYLPGVIERDRNQTEFRRTREDYLAISASDERIAKGRAAMSRHRGLLQAVGDRYGVPAEIVTAIWGVESRYGERRGEAPVISALSTLAYDGRRGAFFESELISALRILQAGDTTPGNMTGSWAGAMGHTQFIPSSYLAYAVDFDGDGRRNIWSDDPTDALASAAAYLDRNGWRRGQPWAIEVRLPRGFDAARAGRGRNRSASEWNAQGVRAADGSPLAQVPTGAVLPPPGGRGPGFLVFHNFRVLMRYNNSENYALGVGHLADRIEGAGPLRGSFGPDANGMTLEDRKLLQRRLMARGFDTGGADGVIGSRTEAAIRAYQSKAGLPVTGIATPDLVRALG